MDLFVYGTLQSVRLMAAVAGGQCPDPIAAQLDGYAVLPVAGDVVPMIKADPATNAAGMLYRGLTPFQVQHLDLFEGAFSYSLVKVTVETAKGAHVAQMYLPPDGIEAGTGQWSLEEWETNHLAPMLDAVCEVFAHDPLLDQSALRRMWPMIEKRAWARHRAATENLAPATLRYQPKADDVEIFNFGPPAGQFFRFDQFEVNHIRFDGTQSPDLNREIFIGTDAVLILPYDAERDRVLLVEQLRMGPALRGDPNPWSLEPVAGMVDARETPLEAGLREAVEEAGLTFSKTERMMSYYPSPGGSTDYFTCFVGLCDLPDTESYTGGLDGESEDLRLHTLPFDAAFALVQSGEINAGPLITMLYWLDRERDRLRSTA